MRGFSRAAMWVVFGVVVAVALSAGAFAVANGSIGEPAGPVSVAPQDAGKQTPENDHPTPSLRPTPSATPSKDGPHQGSQTPSSPSSTSTTTSTVTITRSPSASPSHDDHGGSGEDD